MMDAWKLFHLKITGYKALYYISYYHIQLHFSKPDHASSFNCHNHLNLYILLVKALLQVFYNKIQHKTPPQVPYFII